MRQKGSSLPLPINQVYTYPLHSSSNLLLPRRKADKVNLMSDSIFYLNIAPPRKPDVIDYETGLSWAKEVLTEETIVKLYGEACRMAGDTSSRSYLNTQLDATPDDIDTALGAGLPMESARRMTTTMREIFVDNTRCVLIKSMNFIPRSLERADVKMVGDKERYFYRIEYDPKKWFEQEFRGFTNFGSGLLFGLAYTGILQAMGCRVAGSGLEGVYLGPGTPPDAR